MSAIVWNFFKLFITPISDRNCQASLHGQAENGRVPEGRPGEPHPDRQGLLPVHQGCAEAAFRGKLILIHFTRITYLNAFHLDHLS
jgi:hypothetical protein